MAEEGEQRKADEVAQHVADEGNVPGQSSTRGIVAIVVFLLIGLGLFYLASAYAPPKVPSFLPQSVRP
jgi:hypothetical protein